MAYFLAYGPALSLRQMSYRCPGARQVGFASLEDHRLVFRGSKGAGVLTVEPCAGSAVPLGVWQITEADEFPLERFVGWPTAYRKETRRVQFTRFSSGETETVDALIFILNEGSGLNVPAPWYLEYCADGYYDFGFDLRVLQDAVLASDERRRRHCAQPSEP